MTRMMFLLLCFWIFIFRVSASQLDKHSGHCTALINNVRMLYRSIAVLLKNMTERDNIPIYILKPTNRCLHQPQFDFTKETIQILPKAIHEMEIFMEYLKEEETQKLIRGEVAFDFSKFISRYIVKTFENLKSLPDFDQTVKCSKHHFKLKEVCILSNVLKIKNYVHHIKHQLISTICSHDAI